MSGQERKRRLPNKKRPFWKRTALMRSGGFNTFSSSDIGHQFSRMPDGLILGYWTSKDTDGSSDIGLNVLKTDIGSKLLQRCGETRGHNNFVVPNPRDLVIGLGDFKGNTYGS